MYRCLIRNVLFIIECNLPGDPDVVLRARSNVSWIPPVNCLPFTEPISERSGAREICQLRHRWTDGEK